MNEGSKFDAAGKSDPADDIKAASSHASDSSHHSSRARVPPESGVPQNLVYLGIAVGLVLILIGMVLLVIGKPSLLSSLMTCVGFGIVLAAFGSKAGGSWAGWTATGAGAMAIALFLILQHYTPVSSLAPAKRGLIRGDLSKIADMRIIDETPLYQYRDPTTFSIRFIVLDRLLKSQRMSIQVDTTEDGAGREFFEMLANSQVIAERYLSESIDLNRVVQWEFDYDRRIIKDGNKIIFAEPEQLDENMLPKKAAESTLSQLTSIVSTALAQSADEAIQTEGQFDPQIAQIDRPMIDGFISDLRSDDVARRRNARDALAAGGLSSVAPMMASLRANPHEYRIRLGVIYALSTILKRNPTHRAAVSAVLVDEDFRILVSAASDDDNTVRLQAAEFLYLLEDSRTIPYSLDAARETPDDHKALNQIKILGKAGQNLPQSEQNNVIRDLQTGPGANNDLVGNDGWLRKNLGF